MIIPRPKEVKRISETRKWILVYGRRKTGKSFLVENFIKYDEYFFVKRDRGIISKNDEKTITYETFLALFGRALGDEKTIVVDEFHRLGEDFLDFLHAAKKTGKLILISSTLFLSKKMFGKSSPILGLFAENPIWIIDLRDCISALQKNRLKKKELVELAILLREPIAIDYFEESMSPKEMFVKVLGGSVKSIPTLVGEIFTEEERTLTRIYDAILGAIADGKVTSGEISTRLFARNLISKNDSSIVQQYLSNLLELGLIRKIEVYGKNKFTYKHSSPLVRLFYYGDEKYNLSEKPLNPDNLSELVNVLLPRIVEDEIRGFLALERGLNEAIVEDKDYEVDACLMRFKKPEIVVEIKWKEKISAGDVSDAERNLSRIDAKEKWLFVPDKHAIKAKTTLKIVDIFDFM